ncbi:hypothetical protein F5Y03DRAFT_360885 [Xylaria venustula]|nr:hypothetical protein F5Y03DRAFT_360885 [Xylaria venustula]
MDPLTTIGLLSNIVQFIDFAARLLSKSRELYKSADGYLIETTELVKVTEHTSHLNKKLADDLGSAAPRQLTAIIEGCQNVSGELLSALGQLKVQGRMDRCKTIRQALKTVLSKKRVQELESRLDRFRREINLHITVDLRNDVQSFGAKLTAMSTQINHSSKSIMDAIIAGKDIFETTLSSQTSMLQTLIDQKAATIERRQEHIVDTSTRKVVNTQICIAKQSARERQEHCKAITSAVDASTHKIKAQMDENHIETRLEFGELNKSFRDLQNEIMKQREMLQKCIAECASARSPATRDKTIKQSNTIVKVIAGFENVYQGLLAILGALNAQSPHVVPYLATPDFWQTSLSRQLTNEWEEKEKNGMRVVNRRWLNKGREESENPVELMSYGKPRCYEIPYQGESIGVNCPTVATPEPNIGTLAWYKMGQV